MSAIKFLFAFALVFAAVAYAAVDVAAVDDAAAPAEPSPGFLWRLGKFFGVVKDDSTAIDVEPVEDQNKFIAMGKDAAVKAGLATVVDGKLQLTRAGAAVAGVGAVVAAGGTAAAVVGKDGMQKGYAALKDKVATFTGYNKTSEDKDEKNSASSVCVGSTVIAAAAFAVLA